MIWGFKALTWFHVGAFGGWCGAFKILGQISWMRQKLTGSTQTFQWAGTWLAPLKTVSIVISTAVTQALHLMQQPLQSDAQETHVMRRNRGNVLQNHENTCADGAALTQWDYWRQCWTPSWPWSCYETLVSVSGAGIPSVFSSMNPSDPCIPWWSQRKPETVKYTCAFCPMFSTVSAINSAWI